MAEKLSVWDIDGTMRPGSLLIDTIKHGVKEGLFDPASFADVDNLTREHLDAFVRSVKGQSHSHFNEFTDMISDEAEASLFPWAQAELAQQRERGDHIVALSLSPDFVVRAFTRGLGLHHGSGSFYGTNGLAFTGHAVDLNKVRKLARYRRQHGLGPAAWAAGDSESDVRVLTKAERAVVVNPSEKLARLAFEYGWQTVIT